MKTHTIDVPAYHVWEFQQALSEAGIDYTRLERTDAQASFVFEIRRGESDGQPAALAAELLLASLEIYTVELFASAEHLQKAIRNAESYGLEVASITVSSRILDKPHQYKLEVRGSERALFRLKLSNLTSSSHQLRTIPPIEFKTPSHALTASRGGSGKGTVAWFSHPGRTDDRSAI